MSWQTFGASGCGLERWQRGRRRLNRHSPAQPLPRRPTAATADAAQGVEHLAFALENFAALPHERRLGGLMMMVVMVRGSGLAGPMRPANKAGHVRLGLGGQAFYGGNQNPASTAFYDTQTNK